MCLACGSGWRVDPRLARARAQVHPPLSRRCKVASFCIGRSLAPWIIRTRCGPQPEEKAACAVLSCRLYSVMQPTHQ